MKEKLTAIRDRTKKELRRKREEVEIIENDIKKWRKNEKKRERGEKKNRPQKRKSLEKDETNGKRGGERSEKGCLRKREW